VLLRSAELIGWALGGLEREIVETRKRLTVLTDQAARLRSRLGRKGTTGPIVAPNVAGGESPRRRRRRRMSPEARKRISEMMKKRWAERKKRS
jgi:hypothetical protein